MSNNPNPPKIDFDALQAKINDRMDSLSKNDDSGMPSADYLLPSSVLDPSEAIPGLPSNAAPEQSHDEQTHMHLEEPFMILQFTHVPTEEEGVFNIESFRLNLGGINPNKAAILAHLKMAVTALEEQPEEDEITAEDENAGE